jgi:hypothetical protein
VEVESVVADGNSDSDDSDIDDDEDDAVAPKSIGF